MSNSPIRKIEIPKVESELAKADIDACDRAFDLIYVHHEEISTTAKVAWLLRKVASLEAELSATKDKAIYNSTIGY